jgi:hypothetical protein
MIRDGMRPRRFTGPALPIVVLAASQVGHLLASELRTGPRTAAHAYVPALTTIVLGVAGAAVLAGVLAVAAASVARTGARAAIVPRRRPALLDVSAILFAIQFALFLAQETVEAAVAGAAQPDVAGLLLWGSLGQLPVAVLAALAVRWLGARFDAAADELAAAAGRALATRPAIAPASSAPPPRPSRRPRLLVAATTQRGPPHLPPLAA